jgi:NitT/TauT family transport system permease protein
MSTMRTRRFNALDGFYSASLLVLLLAGWEAAVRLLEIPAFIVPAPSRMLAALWSGLTEGVTSSAGFYLHSWYTVGEALLGFVIGSGLGVLLGTLISQSKFAERIIFPYILAFQCLPKVAIAPLLVVWFGTGFSSKVVIVAMLTFFPLLVNSIAGFESVNRDQVALMRSFKATRWQIFRKVEFPNALPFIFAGLNMAIVYSLIGALVGEFLGARRGLGVLIVQLNFTMDMAGVFAIFVVLAAIGMVLYFAMRWIERRVTFWTDHSKDMLGL